MSGTMSGAMSLDGLCRNGLAALDRALSGEAAPETDPIADATRCTAELRDELIARLRRGDSGAEQLLAQANALLSELVAAEFPVAGFRRERIEKAREAYRALVARRLS
jgi:hypothetical protein